MALDPIPNFYRLPTFWSKDLCLEVLTVLGNELRLFLGTTFNAFSYEAALSEIQTHHLPDDEWMRYVLRYSHCGSQ